MTKTALITGGAVRIGREIAIELARAGYRLIIHYRSSAEAAELLCEELNTINRLEHRAVPADLGDPQGIERLGEVIYEEADTLQLLINNASTYHRRTLATLSPADWEEDYLINCQAPFRLMQFFYHACQNGHIINILDQRVSVTDAGAGSYGLAKKTLRDITDATAVEWAPAIRVNAIAPGYIMPPPGVPHEKMLKHLEKIPMKVNCSPEDIARSVRFLDEVKMMNGQTIYLDGGLHLTGLN